MLSSFKKPRKNASAAKQQKINVAKKLASRPVSPPSSDTEVSDSSSDSDYEEILISSLRKSKPEPPVVPEPHDESNHSNHFTEPEPAKPAKQAEPKPSNAVRTKRKKVVIKKYYQQRQPSTHVHAPPVEPQESSHVARVSYIGLGGMGPDTTATTMRSRLMNW